VLSRSLTFSASRRLSPLLANLALHSLDQHLEQYGLRFPEALVIPLRGGFPEALVIPLRGGFPEALVIPLRGGFVRYADDFVVLTKTKRQAQEALPIVAQHLETLGLTLSPEKTHVTSFGHGFDFLGFRITANGIRMRDKSVEKFKDKVRDITRRSHNLDAELIGRLNSVIRGTANYFATPFTRMADRFRRIDSWIRMRLRCMKLKRKWQTDNRRVLNKHLARAGLLSLAAFC
jgi:hypothetical protein